MRLASCFVMFALVIQEMNDTTGLHGGWRDPYVRCALFVLFSLQTMFVLARWDDLLACHPIAEPHDCIRRLTFLYISILVFIGTPVFRLCWIRCAIYSKRRGSKLEVVQLAWWLKLQPGIKGSYKHTLSLVVMTFEWFLFCIDWSTQDRMVARWSGREAIYSGPLSAFFLSLEVLLPLWILNRTVDTLALAS